MSKIFIRCLSVFLTVVMIAATAAVSYAVDSTEPQGEGVFVFVHGMLGWGSYDEETETNPYWGMTTGTDLIEELNKLGYTCVNASVGGLSSAWDRACELYAQLVGGTVDYGEVHSSLHKHSRYGCTYETPLMENFGGTDEAGNPVQINLLGHSFGGPAIRVFASLMAYGDTSEVEASGDDVSPLFTGGKSNLIRSVVTLSSPTNGTPVADLVCLKLPFMLPLISLYANVRGIKNDSTDLRLNQFGLSGENVKLNLLKVADFASANDNCGIDMTIAGAKALNAQFPTVDDIYYFCYGCDTTEEAIFGNRKPSDETSSMMSAMSTYIGCCGGKKYGGQTLTDEWEANDGLVPVISAMEPEGAEAVDFTTAEAVTESGVWYRMPIVESGDHSYFMGVNNDQPLEFYVSLLNMLNGLE